jgi:hypothetical protein
MNSKLYSSAALLAIFSVLSFLTGCDPKDPIPVEEQELITTLTISLQKIGTTDDPVTFSWKDLDGSGSDLPVIDEIVLDAHSEYKVTLELLNESGSPAENISAEIEEEDEDHQFFFSATNVDGVVFEYDDADENGKPIGLKNIVLTDHFGTGTLSVILLHLPDKNGIGVADGNPANAGGETDLEIEFPLVVQE